MLRRLPSRLLPSRLHLHAALVAASFCLVVPAGAEVVTLAPARDTTLSEDPSGDTGSGAAALLAAGRAGGSPLGPRLVQRGLIYFDVAAAIPAGSTVTGVTLSLTADYQNNDTTPRVIEIHRVLSAWGEGLSLGGAATAGDATWSHSFYPTTMWSTPGGDFDISISDWTVVRGAGPYAWVSAQLRQDVQRWVDDPATNFGWLLRGEESLPWSAKRFHTREEFYRYLQPSLIVSYVPPGTGPTCTQDARTLCLDHGRFAVTATWQADTASGTAFVHPLTSNTGYLWFFADSNVEAVVKVLDACGFNQRFWVFAGGLTDVNVVMTVTDTVTGLAHTYTNPAHTAIQPIADTDAFATCDAAPVAAVRAEGDALPSASDPVTPAPSHPADPPTATGGCVADATSLCLNAGRFRVRAHYDDLQGHAGDARAIALTGDTGYFWFFDSSNVEVVVKALDGCAVNQRYWVYGGGLTDVHVVMTVTDTLTGATQTYVNPPHTSFQPLQDSSAFDGCPSGDAPPHADFSASCVDRTCTVSTRASDDVGITHYRWDWGDGSPVLDAATPEDQTHTYAGSGRFTITETVVDTANQQGSTQREAVPDLAPVAVDDTVTMFRDTTVVIDLLANDFDPDDDALTFGSITPMHPGATYETIRLPDRYALRFTPPDSFVGVMEFSYLVSDLWGRQASATVAVTVNQTGAEP